MSIKHFAATQDRRILGVRAGQAKLAVLLARMGRHFSFRVSVSLPTTIARPTSLKRSFKAAWIGSFLARRGTPRLPLFRATFAGAASKSVQGVRHVWSQPPIRSRHAQSTRPRRSDRARRTGEPPAGCAKPRR
ncbi:hypothetical protein BURKHO8Y_30008 [Burkholderia sp. 8Y]|nr:hypothetical protein BURKHO8Y_30008 [Burkholderia sp. 8Y]